MALVKAKILVEKPKDEFKVQFNPEEYTINQDNNFSNQTIPGLSAPLLQFVNGNMRTLEVELLFDTYDNSKETKDDVRDVTNRFIKLMEINNDLHAPPILRFTWASLDFRCVLARAAQKFIMFGSDGTPVRARITATFNEFIDLEREAKKLNLQTADFSKVHVVKQGETLSGIATIMYENPLMWRPIAIANDIDDPRFIITGQSLRIPPLPFTDPQSGEVM
jgi:LysM repeat protein